MKTIKHFFDTIFFLLLFAALFCTQKRSKKSLVIWGSLIVVSCWFIGGRVYDAIYPYQDCVPATLQRIFPQYTLQEMRHICHTERNGTYVSNFVYAWYILSTNELDIIYSKSDVEDEKTNNAKFYLYKPYLWIGEFQKGGHCALVKFYPTNAIFSNSDFIIGTTNYYLTSIDYSNFFNMTYVVFDSKEIKDNIRFK